MFKFRSLDIYRHVPAELADRTPSGAVLSISGLIFLAILFLSEFQNFISPRITETFVVEQPIKQSNNQNQLEGGHGAGYFHQVDQSFIVPLHLNISFYGIPCVAIGIEVQDLFGSLGYEGVKGLLRYRIDSNGRALPHQPLFFSQTEVGDLRSYLGEGCTVVGQANLEHVPGNIHFLPATNFQQLAYFYSNGFINTSHAVNYFYFGDLTRRDVKRAGLDIAHDPLGKHVRIASDDETAERHAAHLAGLGKHINQAGQVERFHFSSSFEYRLSVVRHQFLKSTTYAFTCHANELVIPRQLPAVFFRYDFHSVTVKLHYDRPSFAHFVTQLCAMLGGVFTVLKLIGRSIKTSSKIMKRDGVTQAIKHKQSNNQLNNLSNNQVQINSYNQSNNQSNYQASPPPMMSPMSPLNHRSQSQGYQTINQSNNQSNNQPSYSNNQASYELHNRSNNQTNNQTINQQSYQPTQSYQPPLNQPYQSPTNQAITPTHASNNQSFNQSNNQSFNQSSQSPKSSAFMPAAPFSFAQPAAIIQPQQPINQPINQSINQSPPASLSMMNAPRVRKDAHRD